MPIQFNFEPNAALVGAAAQAAGAGQAAASLAPARAADARAREQQAASIKQRQAELEAQQADRTQQLQFQAQQARLNRQQQTDMQTAQIAAQQAEQQKMREEWYNRAAYEDKRRMSNLEDTVHYIQNNQEMTDEEKQQAIKAAQYHMMGLVQKLPPPQQKAQDIQAEIAQRAVPREDGSMLIMQPDGSIDYHPPPKQTEDPRLKAQQQAIEHVQKQIAEREHKKADLMVDLASTRATVTANNQKAIADLNKARQDALDKLAAPTGEEGGSFVGQGAQYVAQKKEINDRYDKQIKDIQDSRNAALDAAERQIAGIGQEIQSLQQQQQFLGGEAPPPAEPDLNNPMDASGMPPQQQSQGQGPVAGGNAPSAFGGIGGTAAFVELPDKSGIESQGAAAVRQRIQSSAPAIQAWLSGKPVDGHLIDPRTSNDPIIKVLNSGGDDIEQLMPEDLRNNAKIPLPWSARELGGPRLSGFMDEWNQSKRDIDRAESSGDEAALRQAVEHFFFLSRFAGLDSLIVAIAESKRPKQ